MGSIIKSDIYKLLRDKQTILLIIAYFIFSLLTWVSPAINPRELSSKEIIELSTADFGIIFLFVAIVATSVFALDYSNDTMKDILPYYPRKLVFFSKWLLVIILAVIFQFFCYLFGVGYTLLFNGAFPSTQELAEYANRYIIHLLINLVNIGFILFLASFFKQRYLLNALVLISLLITRFWPIGNGKFLFHYLSERYTWGADFSFSFLAATILLTVLFIMMGYLTFRKREA
ncbi:MAG: ABC transporter permease [Lachnospiraceae bacterium]|nr:ABC transporter permease [Lachnospiraceae bacterium]